MKMIYFVGKHTRSERFSGNNSSGKFGRLY